MMDHSATIEAKAVRQMRADLQREQRNDPLAYRVRLLRLWREGDQYLHPAARATPRFPHVRSLYKNAVFWRYLLPGLRARLEARMREHDRAYWAELRAQSQRWQQIKAERAAAKRRDERPQTELFA